MRWNDPSEWVWSTEIAHDPLVSVDEFEDVQRLIQAGTRPVERAKVNAPPQRKYLLRSRVRCGACRRRMGGTCDTDDKAVVYASLGLTVTFDPLAQTLVAECDIDTAAWGKRSCRRGT